MPKLHFPGLEPAAAKWLVEQRRIKAVGIDTASIDFGQSTRLRNASDLVREKRPSAREPGLPRDAARARRNADRTAGQDRGRQWRAGTRRSRSCRWLTRRPATHRRHRPLTDSQKQSRPQDLMRKPEKKPPQCGGFSTPGQPPSAWIVMGGSPAVPDTRSSSYGRSITNVGEVHVSQCAGLDASPSAFSADTFATYVPSGRV